MDGGGADRGVRVLGVSEQRRHVLAADPPGQVSEGGDLANWHTGAPGAIPAVGGAMDLAMGAKSVFVMMSLFAKDGTAKLVPRCTYPLTGVGCVDWIYTDCATIMINSDGAVVTETFGASVAELQARMEVTLRAPGQASSGS